MSIKDKAEHQRVASLIAGSAGSKLDAVDVCSCGWVLPFAVCPIRLNEETKRSAMGLSDRSEIAEKHVIGDAFVTLACPVCERGHTFFTPEAAQRAGLMRAGGSS